MIGFVYLWMDSGRHSTSHPGQPMFCLGSHRGAEKDRYVTSTGGIRFKNAYKKRPRDFRRRIIQRIYEGNGRTILEAEQRWLDLIKPEELDQRYYNKKKTAAGLSREDLIRIRAADPTIGKRQSASLLLTHEKDPGLRIRMGTAISDAYANDPELGKRQSQIMKDVHIADPSLSKRMSEAMLAAHKADPEIGKRGGATRKALHAADPELGKRQGVTRKALFAADPEIMKRKGATTHDTYVKNPALGQQISERFTGTIWIRKGTVNRRIKLGDPIPEGWVLGMHAKKPGPEFSKHASEARFAALAKDPTLAMRIGAKTKGRIWINNGVKRRRLKPDDPLPEGWHYGYKLKDPIP